MTSTLTLTPDTRIHALPARFELEHGGTLRSAHLAFRHFGQDGGPTIIVQGGISADSRVADGPAGPGWWSPLVGPGRAIDTDRFSVLGVDFLGGPDASTGPRNSSQRPFPILTSVDQARAIRHLVRSLDLDHAPSFVGASFGAMVGLAYAATFPNETASVVAVSAADRPHPLATAWRWVQRSIVDQAIANGSPTQGIELARALAMATYRSADEFVARFDAPPNCDGPEPVFPVTEYLAARGQAYVERSDPDAFLCLSRAIDLHRIDPAWIECPTTLIGARTDQIVPAAQISALGQRLRGSRVVLIDSRFGHDAFLKEFDQLDPVVRHALEVL